MRLRTQVLLAGTSVLLLTLAAILASIRDQLMLFGPWILKALLAVIGLLICFFLYTLYLKVRSQHLKMQEHRLIVEEKRVQIAGAQQMNQIEAQRFQLEMLKEQAALHILQSRVQVGEHVYLIHPHALPSEQQILLLPAQQKQLALPQQAESRQGGVEQDVSVIPTRIQYEDIRAQIPAGRSCLGVSENGVETCDFGQLMTMWICGGSSTGKSNTVALKIDEAIRNGRKIGIILVDPHARKEDSLYNKIRCYERYFLRPVAVSEPDILAALQVFKTEFERRLESGSKAQTDILLVVDEVSNVVESDDEEIGKLIKKIARICGQESRGFGMFGWFISQDAAGLAWLRKRAMTVIAHKLNMMSERKIACNEDLDIARAMDSWPRGRVVFYGLNFQGVKVAQMPEFHPPMMEPATNYGDLDPLSDGEMEPLQPRSVFRFEPQKRNGETHTVSGSETNAEADRDTGSLRAFRVSETDPALSTKKETSGVSAETKKIILRMHRDGMKLRKIAPLVGLGGENYTQFKLACQELGIQPEQPVES